MPRTRETAGLDPRAYLKRAVDKIERDAEADAFALLKGLSPDHPPNELFIQAGKAQAIDAVVQAMRDEIAAAFQSEDDKDEGDER